MTINPSYQQVVSNKAGRGYQSDLIIFTDMKFPMRLELRISMLNEELH
jgi:hypothetical protein